MSGLLRVPTECGDVVADPPLARLGEVLREAQGRLSDPQRRLARQEILGLAARQTAAMDGGDIPVVDAGRPLFVTGHQPDLYHPGIWVKNFILDQVSRTEGVCGLNLTVDSDLAARVIELPQKSADGWRRQAVVLPGIRSGQPWEVQPPLDDGGWQALGGAVRALLPQALTAVFDDFLDTVRHSAAVSGARTLADSLARARRTWEARAGRRAYLELDVSTMCGSATFHDFVASVLARLEAFWEAHNESLRDYRASHHIRTAANPVPDLRRRGDLWETPFWCIHPAGERGGLFLERDGRGWLVESRDTTFGRLDDGDEASWAPQLAAMMAKGTAGLRPRALTLTMFVRRAFADLFLHGIGGARYERVGDLIARRFFGDGGAPYAAASATFCLDTDGEAPFDDPAALRRGLRDLTYNPQRFLPGGDAGKQALIEAVSAAPRGIKKQVGAQIEALNRALRARLPDVEDSLRARLAAAERAQARRAVTGWRGYPYFLFPPGRLHQGMEDELRG